jgi:uncharacterized Rmd1/YagE family protein
MKDYIFSAYSVSATCNLPLIAHSSGFTKKGSRDEPLVLDPASCMPLHTVTGRSASVYPFGSVVFVNCDDQTIKQFLSWLISVLGTHEDTTHASTRETYRLNVRSDQEEEIANEGITVKALTEHSIPIVSYVLAKSVALERLEDQVNQVFRDVGGLVGKLGQGFLELSDRNLAKLAAAVMSFKFTSIDQIMILDKPDVTWDDITAERLYLKLSTMFELQGRYHAITQRAETLLDVTGVLSNLSHARRSARLEWIIIILIALEILLALLYKLA